jgi:hypothetical protein
MRWAVAAFVALLLAAPDASACSLATVFRDGGRYVGGDLVTQIAERAHTIQLVRAVHRMPIGADQGGEHTYAFQFEVVATLVHQDTFWPWDRQPVPGAFSLDGYESLRSLLTPNGFRTMDEVEIWLPRDALDQPGTLDGYLQLHAPGPVHLNRGSCGWPMRVELGEQFVALRDASGRLYAFPDWGVSSENAQPNQPLRIRFAYAPDSGVVESTASPPLIRIESRHDPILARLRNALIANGRLRLQD